MVATNMVMDANAAISRRMSVIAGSFSTYVHTMFLLCSKSQAPLPKISEVTDITAESAALFWGACGGRRI